MLITPDLMKPYAKASNVFVETGTFHGHTTRMAVDMGYKSVYSIECNENFYNENAERFKNDYSYRF